MPRVTVHAVSGRYFVWKQEDVDQLRQHRIWGAYSKAKDLSRWGGTQNSWKNKWKDKGAQDIRRPGVDTPRADRQNVDEDDSTDNAFPWMLSKEEVYLLWSEGHIQIVRPASISSAGFRERQVAAISIRRQCLQTQVENMKGSSDVQAPLESKVQSSDLSTTSRKRKHSTGPVDTPIEIKRPRVSGSFMARVWGAVASSAMSTLRTLGLASPPPDSVHVPCADPPVTLDSLTMAATEFNQTSLFLPRLLQQPPLPSVPNTVECRPQPPEWVFTTDIERHRAYVFRDLWRQGYYMTNGVRFGGDFLVYPGPPSMHHSHFIVRVVKPDTEICMSDFVTVGRLSTTTRKNLVYAFVDDDVDYDVINYTMITWDGQTSLPEKTKTRKKKPKAPAVSEAAKASETTTTSTA